MASQSIRYSPLAVLLALALKQAGGEITISAEEVKSIEEVTFGEWQICQIRDSKTGNLIIKLDSFPKTLFPFSAEELENFALDESVLSDFQIEII